MMSPTKPPVEQSLRKLAASKSPGSRFPSARSLTEELGVGRTAINHAVTRLLGEGALIRVGRKLIIGSRISESRPVVVVIGREEDQLRAAAQTLGSFGAEVEVSGVGNTNERRAQLLELLKSPPAGLLAIGGECEDLLVKLESKGSRVMVCGVEMPELSFVAADESQRLVWAVSKLASMQHAEIALLLRLGETFPESLKHEIIEGYRSGVLSHQLQSSAERIIQSISSRTISATLRKYLTAQSPVTAVISWDIVGANLVIAEARRLGIEVPQDLSVITLTEHMKASHATPPLTSFDVDRRQEVKIAAFLLWDDLVRKVQYSIGTSHQSIICRPVWKLRGSLSCAPLASDAILPMKRARRWPDDTVERCRLAAAENAKCFPSLGKTPPDFRPVNLSQYLNRSFTPRAAWLGGDPLRHFRPGLQTIHGVPFQVGDPANPSRRAACIVLRSAKVHHSEDRPLPSTVEIDFGEAGRNWKALHVLHASGWNTLHEAFATYELWGQHQRIKSINVVSFGEIGSSEDAAKRATKSIVQDWHPSAMPFSSSDVLPYLITKDGDPLRYERYLYHYRIVNKSKCPFLKKFRLTALKPEARATLALLGLTIEV